MNVTDRQIDGRAIAYSERTFAKNGDAQKKRSSREVRGVSPEAGRESMEGKICERGRSTSGMASRSLQSFLRGRSRS